MTQGKIERYHRRRRYNMALAERKEEMIRPAVFREVYLTLEPESVSFP